MPQMLKFNVTKTAILALAAVLSACGAKPLSATKEAWDRANDPLALGDGYERHFGKLSLQAELPTTPWVDDYWPSQKGGIAARWYDGFGGKEEDGFKYKMPSEDEVKKMSLGQLAQLSPAEKYDIFSGRFDYPLVNSERSRNNPKAESWEGICHGWAPAALLYPEPKPVVMSSAQGLKVPFGSGDVKALLTYHQAMAAESGGFLGSRCEQDLSKHPDRGNSSECRDVNAGSFHIVLTNFIAIRKQGFVADVTRDQEVWNQPVYGFNSRVDKWQGPSAGAAPGTTNEVLITTDMYYTAEVHPMWLGANHTDYFNANSKHYKYRLELNKDGEIIGGDWLSETRPDFLWTAVKAEFYGYQQNIAAIEAQANSSETPVVTGGGSQPDVFVSNGKTYPYCVQSGDTGGGYGWEPALNGPNGGSCKIRSAPALPASVVIGNKTFPYCEHSADTGGGYGWEPSLHGPNGGSCKIRAAGSTPPPPANGGSVTKLDWCQNNGGAGDSCQKRCQGQGQETFICSQEKRGDKTTACVAFTQGTFCN